MKKFILAVAVAAVATMAVASSAFADVARYQTQSMTITAVQPENAVGQWTNVWTHTYNVTLNPCDGSFSGVGSQKGTIDTADNATETIKGHLDRDAVSLTATRSDDVVYSLSKAPLDGSTATLATSTPVVPWISSSRSASRTPCRRRTIGITVTASARWAVALTQPTRASGCRSARGRRPSSCSHGGGSFQGVAPFCHRGNT